MNLLLISYEMCFGIFVWKLILKFSVSMGTFPLPGIPHCDLSFVGVSTKPIGFLSNKGASE